MSERFRSLVGLPLALAAGFVLLFAFAGGPRSGAPAVGLFLSVVLLALYIARPEWLLRPYRRLGLWRAVYRLEKEYPDLVRSAGGAAALRRDPALASALARREGEPNPAGTSG